MPSLRQQSNFSQLKAHDLKNFATVVAQKNRLLLYLHLNPKELTPLPAIGRDVSQQGH